MRLAALFLIFLAATAPAQPIPGNSQGEASTKNDAIPPPRDIPYPGTISLSVDASEVQQGIFRTRQRIPVAQAGDLVLLFPQWLPGHHSPSGKINKLAGLKISANGKPLEWARDTIDVYTFHVNVPAGVAAVDVEFQFVSPTADNQGRTLMTPEMASIQWVSHALYPAGYYVRRIPIEATLKVPLGWKVATALKAERSDHGVTTYEIVPFDTLMDSPAIAGPHYRQFMLTPDVALDVIADTPEELEAKPEHIAAHKRLVEQSLKLFGARHYDRYRFLLTISKNLGDIGLEHHRSSENGVDPGYFTDWDNAQPDRNLLPHEFTHSWNGKFRRPRDMWTPDYRVPMEDSLLWVYEGQTQYWGYVLGARSGMLSKDETLGALASIAAAFDENTPGRAWRPLIDTTNDPIIAERAPQPWRSWQRSEDYYNEGLLIWLDVDRIIRDGTNGKQSLDDFARAFFGMKDGDYGELSYTREELVAALNGVLPYDWAGYFRRRFDEIAPKAPIEGITQGGYRLIYSDEQTGWLKSLDKQRNSTDLSYSGGFVVGKDGRITTVIWDGAAFNAGLTVGSELLAVDGRSFSADRFKTAIKSAKGKREPIKLLVKSGDLYRTVDLAWNGGLRYPRLEKAGKGPSTLDALLAPR